MQPYGLKKNWSVTEDYYKTGSTIHRRGAKMFHRVARRIAKHQIKKEW